MSKNTLLTLTSIVFFLITNRTTAQFNLDMAEMEPSKIIEPPIATSIEGAYVCPLYTQYLKYGFLGICAYPDGLIKNCDASMAKGLSKGGFYIWDTKSGREIYRKDGFKGIPKIYTAMSADHFVVLSKDELSVYDVSNIKEEEEEGKVKDVEKEFENLLSEEVATNIGKVDLPYKKIDGVAVSFEADYVAVSEKKTKSLAIIDPRTRTVIKKFEPQDFVINGQQREIKTDVMVYDFLDNLIVALEALDEGGDPSDANLICIAPGTFEINALKTLTNKLHDSPKTIGVSALGELAAFYPDGDIISIFEHTDKNDYKNEAETAFVILGEERKVEKPEKRVFKDRNGTLNIQLGKIKGKSDPSKLFKPAVMTIDGDLLFVAFGSLKGIGIWDISDFKRIGVIGDPYSHLDSYRNIGFIRYNQVYGVSRAPDLIEIFDYQDIQKTLRKHH